MLSSAKLVKDETTTSFGSFFYDVDTYRGRGDLGCWGIKGGLVICAVRLIFCFLG